MNEAHHLQEQMAGVCASTITNMTLFIKEKLMNISHLREKNLEGKQYN